MIKQKFNISKKPEMVSDAAAYFVDYKNVEMHQQYVKKYYQPDDLDWFDRTFIKPMRNNEEYTLILYYRPTAISFDYRLETSRASNDNFTIYYVVTNKVLITVE